MTQVKQLKAGARRRPARHLGEFRGRSHRDGHELQQWRALAVEAPGPRATSPQPRWNTGLKVSSVHHVPPRELAPLT